MTFINPHDQIGTVQLLYWNQLPEKKICKFILVDYFNAKMSSGGNSTYINYFAVVDEDIDELGIKKGDEVLLSITIRSYVIALNMLPRSMSTPCQRKFGEGKNLYIELEKANCNKIKVHYQELRVPDEEQLLKAKRQYDRIRE